MALRRRWGPRRSPRLLRDGKAIGGIAIRRKEIDPFTRQEIAQLKTFADQAVIAIKVRACRGPTQLLSATDRTPRGSSIVDIVQTALASKLDFRGVIYAVGDKIREIFPKETVMIGLIDYEHSMVRIPYVYDIGKRDRFSDGFPLGQGLSNVVFSTRQPLLINTDLAKRSVELGGVSLAYQHGEQDWGKSWLGVPIVVGDKVIGSIALENPEHENAYSDSDVRLLQTLANSMSVALKNARGLTRLSGCFLKETEHKAAELEIINSVQEGLASKLEMQAIYDRWWGTRSERSSIPGPSPSVCIIVPRI